MSLIKLPTDPQERKKIPLFTGLFKYFPRALVEIAKVSYIGSKQHHPNDPVWWDKSKSTDQEDTFLRHLMEAGTIDTDGSRHTAKMVWRAIAMLELELEAEDDSDNQGPKSDQLQTVLDL